MKNHMKEHIENTKTDMFQESVDGVKARLTDMCRSVEEEMSNKADEVWSTMNRDYTQVISGTQLPEGEQMPKWERLLRAELAKLIRERGEAMKKAEDRANDPHANYLAALQGEDNEDVPAENGEGSKDSDDD